MTFFPVLKLLLFVALSVKQIMMGAVNVNIYQVSYSEYHIMLSNATGCGD